MRRSGKLGKVEALIISRRSVGEADRLLTFFTREHGVLRVVAKGVRRIPSRRGGHVEPYTRVLGILHGSRTVFSSGPGHYFLAGVNTLDSFPELVRHQEAYEQVRVLSRMIVSLLTPEEPQPQLYNRLQRLWLVLPRVRSQGRWLLELGMMCELLRTAGVFPGLSVCTDCGRQGNQEAVILDGAAGGWHCLTCHPGLAGTHCSVPASALSVLQLLAQEPRRAFRMPLASEFVRQLLNAMRVYVSHVVEQPLPVVADRIAYA